MRLFLAGLGLLLCTQFAFAGAWNREKGSIFLASGANLWVSDGTEVPFYYDATIYAEYGLTELVTLGLDAFTTDNDSYYNGLVFAQFPLGDTSARDRWAASIGLGARSDFTTSRDWLMRGGLSWGRGLNSGWLAIDTSATYTSEDETFRPKADFTWGENLSDSWTVMAQLQTGTGFDDTKFVKASPALIYSLTDNLRISLAGVYPLKGVEETAVRLSFWSTY